MPREIIDGPVGSLELIIESPANWADTDPIAICCHPHPLHGGSMQNKVVHILAKTFLSLNAKVVRFNFRGVGKSSGEFADGIGEREDLYAVTDWVKRQWPQAPLWLAGFSFGASVSIFCHEKINPQRLVLVAPPVDMYPAIKNVAIQTKEWLLVQGGQDEIVSSDAVLEWANQQKHPPRLIHLQDTGHFFHGQLNVVKERILAIWNER
ncbi:MAG: alpha/beta hydrolase [Thioalkalispiraceae bacterium]|jgi:alpha/beta superfamily hydrolase